MTEKSRLAEFLLEGSYKLPYKESLEAHKIVDAKLKKIGEEIKGIGDDKSKQFDK